MNILDEYPAKRRKTSPFTSIVVTPSDMLKTSASPDGHISSLTDMSPAKTDLACFNPNEVLSSIPVTDNSEQQQKEPAQHTKGDLQEYERISTSINEPLSLHQPRCDSGSEKLFVRAESPARVAFAAPGRTEMVSVNGAFKRMSPIEDPHLPPSGQYQAAMAGEPRASPPADDGEGGLKSPSAKRSKWEPISQGPSTSMVNETSTEGQHVRDQGPSIEREPELPYTPKKQSINVPDLGLPPTPTQLGLEAPPTPPKGLVSAYSPRKLRRRRQVVHKSSPLKIREAMNTDKADEIPYVSNLGPRIPVLNIRRSAQMCTLDAQHAQLQADNSMCSNPIAGPGRHNSRIVHQTTSLAERLALFLPFSRPPTLTLNSGLPRLSPPPDELPASTVSKPPETTPAEFRTYSLPPQSSMTAVDSLDASQSPLSSMTATESLDPSHAPDSVSQLQHITFTAHQQLLVIDIQIMIDKTTKNLIELKTSSISSWADPELGRWLRNEAKSLDRALIERAVTSYWETSLIRAACWQKCEEEIGATCIKPLTNSDKHELQSVLTQKKPPGRRKLIPPTTIAPRFLQEKPAPTPTPTSHSLQTHLGRQSLLFTRTPASLLITWHVSIIPNGAVENHISAHPVYPTRWMDVEGGQALHRVEEAFQALLARKGVFESVKELCSRMFAG
jgi:hypothetical protein